MVNFWDFSAWGGLNLLVALLLAMLLANALKKNFRFLQVSLIPTSVLAGLLLLVISAVYESVTGDVMFNTPFIGGNGMAELEIMTYHALALGFIASTLKNSDNKLTGKRAAEIFNTGVTTVATYLIQAVIGLAITIVAAMIVKDFFSAAGLLLPFGFGQGTGQALNYGSIYENQYGFVGGKSFGLTVAALGFLSASFGGVVCLNILKRKGRKTQNGVEEEGSLRSEDIQSDDEIPMNGSLDKLTVQLAQVAGAYLIAYLLMYGLGLLLPGMKSTIYGFNFLLGVIAATLVKAVLSMLKKSGIMKKQYTNNFLMNRISNCCFDVMVTAGIAAIRLEAVKEYWLVLAIMSVVGLMVTYAYNWYVAKKLFPDYADEQFLVMYGMLTGTASTGIMLLREVDPDFKTPAQENLVYQNFPAIVFGFPIMLLATIAPEQPVLVLGLVAAFFVVLNIILFRRQIFRRRKK